MRLTYWLTYGLTDGHTYGLTYGLTFGLTFGLTYRLTYRHTYRLNLWIHSQNFEGTSPFDLGNHLLPLATIGLVDNNREFEV